MWILEDDEKTFRQITPRQKRLIGRLISITPRHYGFMKLFQIDRELVKNIVVKGVCRRLFSSRSNGAPCPNFFCPICKTEDELRHKMDVLQEAWRRKVKIEIYHEPWPSGEGENRFVIFTLL